MQVDDEAGEAPQAPQAPRKILNKIGKGLGKNSAAPSAAPSLSRASGASLHSAASVYSAVSRADVEEEEQEALESIWSARGSSEGLELDLARAPEAQWF